VGYNDTTVLTTLALFLFEISTTSGYLHQIQSQEENNSIVKYGFHSFERITS